MFEFDPNARVVFVQNGDFRAADQRMRDGVGETYHAQRYSMQVVERMAAQVTSAAVVSIDSEDPHDETLASGVRSIGLSTIWHNKRPFDAVIDVLEALDPTHLVVRLPSLPLLTWGRGKTIRVLPSFADSFTPRAGLRGLRDRWRMRTLAAALNDPSVQAVGNHNIAAAQALQDIGVAAAKIVPWDWPRSPTPEDFPVKTAPNAGPKRLLFAGTVSEPKGVGDIIRALASAPLAETDTGLDVLGDGNIDAMRALATELGVAERVRFLGRVPHADVAPAMHAADAVLVYSHHAYGEGLPGSLYAGLASRTPLVTSDHPMFTGYFESGRDLVMVPERTPDVLSAAIQDLFEDPALYHRLSENSLEVFNRISHPVHWGEFVERWLRDTPEDRTWLAEQALPNWQRT